MKLHLVYLAQFLFSCKLNKKPSEPVKEKMPVKVQVASSRALSYYKCDYSKRGVDTILSSGNNSKIDEVWCINKGDIKDLTTNNLSCLDLPAFIEKATRHLESRYPDMNLNVSEVSIIRKDNVDTNNPRSWFVEVHFLYDKRGLTQIVPFLVDGRVILSNRE